MGWAKDVKEKQQVMEMQTNPTAASCFSQHGNRHRQMEAWNGMGRTQRRVLLASVVTLRITRDWSVHSDVPWPPHPFPALGMLWFNDVTPVTPCVVFAAAAFWVWLQNDWCSQEYTFFPGLRWIDLILSACVIRASAWADHNPGQPMEQSPAFPDGWCFRLCSDSFCVFSPRVNFCKSICLSQDWLLWGDESKNEKNVLTS